MSKLGSLADRVRKAVSEDEERRRTEADAEQRRAAERKEAEARAAEKKREAQAARGELLTEIEAFGRAVGRLEVSRDGDAVTLAYGARRLRFEPDGEYDRIALVPSDQTVPRNHFVERDLSGEWEVAWDEGDHLVHHGLEEGLERLLGAALGLPVGAPAEDPATQKRAPVPRRGRKPKGVSPGSGVTELKDPLD